MNELIKVFLSLSISGTLLILALFLCKTLYKDKLSRQWQYYIWLIVIVRLLIPFAPETNLVGNIFQRIDNVSIRAENSPQYEQNSTILPETDLIQDYEPTGGNTGLTEAEQQPRSEIQPEKPEIQPMQNALGRMLQHVWVVWLIGVIALLIRKITVYQSFVKYIKAGRDEISDIAIWERFGKLVEQSGVKRTVGVYTNILISSPLLIGFFRPCIMLPTTELSDSDFQYTILHELTHYKRMDMFYRWLVQITICLHWFNPFVYLMGREINRACELSCDEAVIRKLDTNSQRAYGDTLLNALGIGGNYKDSLASVTLTESKELLKERLDAIMNYKKKTWLVLCITVLLTTLLLCGFTMAGAYTINADNTPLSPTTLVNANNETNNPYFEKYSARPEMSISAHSRSNNWATSDTATGSTIQEILDNKLQFIESVWQEEKELFIIAEGISADGITDVNSLQYLYDKSDTYRNMITVDDNVVYIEPESSFSMVADAEHNPIYTRYAFCLQESAELSLSASYQVEIGKMSIIIVSPSGKIVYQNDLTANFDDTISVSLDKGISSVVLVYETEAVICSGDIDIMGNIRKGISNQATSVVQPQQIVDSRLTLIEKEYTLTDLQAFNISGLVVEALSENILITRGGKTLKIQYYVLGQNDYTLQKEFDGGGTRENLCLLRKTPLGMDEAVRSISITIPDEANLKVIKAITSTGNITLENCTASLLMGAETKSGQVFINGCSATGTGFLNIVTDSGNALIAETALGDGLYRSNFDTQTGTISFQPKDSAQNYCLVVYTGEDAQITVNGKKYAGGDYEINDDASKRIYFDSPNGSFIVQDLSIGEHR